MEKDILLSASNEADLKFITAVLLKTKAKVSQRIQTAFDCIQILKVINSSNFKLIFMYPKEDDDLCVNTYIHNLCLSNKNAVLIVLKKTISIEDPKQNFILKNYREIWLKIDIFEKEISFLNKLISTLLENPPIYISYGNNPESENILKTISSNFKKVFSHVAISFDRNELRYKQNIDDYIGKLVKGKNIILLINKKYLESKYCFEEFLEIYANSEQYNELKSRIYPIIMKDADIYFRDPVKMKKDIISVWEQRKTEIENSLRQGHNNEEQDELNLVDRILNIIPRFTKIIKNFYQLPMDTLEKESFFPIFWQINEQMKKNGYIKLYQTEDEMKKALGLGY